MGGHADAIIILALVIFLAIAAGNFSLSLYDVNFLNLEYFFNRIYQFITGGTTGANFDLLNSLVKSIIWSVLVSILLIIGMIYFISRIRDIRREEKIKFASVLPSDLEAKTYRNEQWDNLLKYLESENSSDWKLAILEADKLLDKMVEKMGYPGANLGERLRVIEPSDFLTLQEAWEAHKIRNRIAHEAQYQLTEHEARKTIGLYEKVFREFHYI
ncbi:MAG: hypothetical protein COV09_01050 [Candidatus Vogelbacteria bacterium CG10_big_fil_rev_8_21_14_0_10_50_13]|uniref:Uncharacterized protein n=1 Tax=Candidatus Vogelbacteria bacterium CG10_big_fil_rev_8_21_14_0_10_50_13 TaxID=1975044 RepID=A0A2H0RIA5_9BACT|nr:MAG: hypothetical protein COV09_01050 [Candidatus Vogelbacteria bacterium CG10_big_fil_rev_8_21_14_0_10_50_13]